MKTIRNEQNERKTLSSVIPALVVVLLLSFGSGPRLAEAEDVSDLKTDHAEGVKIGNVVARIVDAYESKDPERFMAHVSENFTGGRLAFDSAIRQDFSLLDNIDLHVSISNLAVASSGHIHAVLTYSRTVVSTRSGRPLHDTGMTELIFESEGGIPLIYTIKNPVLFGVSQAFDIASGVILSQTNDEILVVNDRGEVVLMPIDEAKERLPR